MKIGDLIMAAAAERAGLVVLHYDRDFDRITGITNQPTEWVVPAGTADQRRRTLLAKQAFHRALS